MLQKAQKMYKNRNVGLQDADMISLYKDDEM